MSSSRSSASSNTNTTDQRTTNTINAGLGGDVLDSFVATGNYGETSVSAFYDESVNELDFSTHFEDHADNSLNVDMEDNSYSHFNDESVFADYSDNSLKVDMTDNSGSTNSGNRTTTSSYQANQTHNTNITDGGAFAVVNSLIGKVTDSFSKSNERMIDLLGVNQQRTLSSANDLAARSLDGAMSIKKSEVSGEAASAIADMGQTALKLAAVAAAAFAVVKVWGKK